MIPQTKCVPWMNAEVSTLTDKSGAGYDGTRGSTATWGDNSLGGKNLVFAGDANSKVEYGDIQNAYSVSIWVALSDTTEVLWQHATGAGNGAVATAGTIAYTGWDNCFVNGTDTNTVTTALSLITVVSSTPVDCTAFTIGELNNVHLTGTVYGWAVYEYQVTLEQHTQEYEAHKNDY